MSQGNHFPADETRQTLQPSPWTLTVKPHASGGVTIIRTRFYWDGLDWNDESEPTDDLTVYATPGAAARAIAAMLAPQLSEAA